LKRKRKGSTPHSSSLLLPRLGPVRPEQHRHRHNSSSPIKKLINLLVGMCKRQRDIEVEQQMQWRTSKKERDSVKMMHNAMNL